MHRFFGIFLALLNFLIVASFEVIGGTNGDFDLRLKYAGSRQELHSFMDETEKLLPEEIKRTIRVPIEVEFVLGESRSWIPVPSCDETSQATSFPSAYSSYKKKKGLYTIQLDSRLRLDILDGPEGSRKIDCRFRSMYAFAQAALMEPIARIFDRETYRRESGDMYSSDIIPKFSDRRQFLRLAGWVDRGLIFKKRVQSNVLSNRSLNPSEMNSPEDFFAMNMAAYLLDPEFACRRPALNQFFAENIGPKTRATECELYSEVLTDPMIDSPQLYKVNLDPSRIYQIHLLIADKGDSMGAGWGHAMFRMVICSPERAVVNEDCLKDISEHMVLSFRANPDDILLDGGKALSGKYPSKPFLFPFSSVVSEYTEYELRDLMSFPIDLTDEQKTMFVYRVLELVWEYEGRYYFLSNNCTHESLALLQGIISDEAFQYLQVLKPFDLLNKLDRRGYIDKNRINDAQSAQASGFYFPSKFRLYEKIVQSWMKASPDHFSYNDFREFMNTSRAEDRGILYRGMLQPYEDGGMESLDARKLRAQFRVFERYFVRKNIKDQVREFTRFAEQSQPNDPAIKTIEWNKDALNQLVVLTKPRRGYGVPTVKDFDVVDHDQYAGAQKDWNDSFEAFQIWATDFFKDLSEEQVQIEANLQEFGG